MNFITPKNFKKGRLIANKYRIIDLVILITTIILSISIILTYLLFDGKNLLIVILACLPSLVGFILVLPFGIYHNYLIYLKLLYVFKQTEKQFIYSGINYLGKNTET